MAKLAICGLHTFMQYSKCSLTSQRHSVSYMAKDIQFTEGVQQQITKLVLDV